MTGSQSVPLKDQLKRHEGRRLDLYKCPAGKWTIGYGRNLEARGISRDEAELMLDNDIKFYTEQVEKSLPWAKTDLNEARKSVLVNMAFNMGMVGLLGFKKMLAAARRGDYVSAAAEMVMSDWYQQVGPGRGGELTRQMAEGVEQG